MDVAKDILRFCQEMGKYIFGKIISFMREFSKYVAIDNIATHRSNEWNKLENILLTTTLAILGGSGVVGLGISKTVVLKYHHVLAFSWVLLSLSLIFLMLSYAFCDYLTWDLVKKLKGQPEMISEEIIEGLKSKIASRGLSAMNYASLICTILGIILLILFVYLNII